MINNMNTDNSIFYSTANAGYAIYSATSLLTVRDHLPDAKLCVLSSGLNEYDIKILKKHGISYEILDLSDKFTKIWDYPIECYYLFAGPEVFHKQGYAYSVYIDGDVLCNHNPLNRMGHIKGAAGVISAPQKGKYISIFGEDWPIIKKLWGLPSKLAHQKRINSGVVYFNNKAMADFNLLQKASELFIKSVDNNIPRKGDDSLFSLLQYVYSKDLPVSYLDPAFNYVLQFNEWRYPVKNLVFFHFSIDKPWKKHPYSHDNSDLDTFNPYVKTWRSKFRQVAPKSWLKSIW
jgi:lipopolysaccharide biosynthesis glycosyltransferase